MPVSFNDNDDVQLKGATDGSLVGNVGDRLKVDATASAVVSAENSTSTPLAANATFTGTFVDVLDYAVLSVLVKANVTSATSGVKIEWSANGTDVHADDLFTHAGTNGDQWSFGIQAQYMRIRYVNGGGAQASFVLQALLHRTAAKPSSHRIDDLIDADDDAELVKAVLTGKKPNGEYANVTTDSDGNLIATLITGFGSDFTFGDVTLSTTLQSAIRRTAYVEPTTNAQRSVSSTSTLDTSAGTGARTVQITYLDQAGAGPFTEVVTLNGLTAVNTVATDICFIEDIQVLTGGALGANQGIITLHSATAGVGAIGTIGAGDNQTFWAHHYVPASTTANVSGISASHNGTTVGSGGLFVLKAKNLADAAAIERQVSDFVRLYGQNSTFSRTYPSPIKVPGPARLLLYVTPESNPTFIYRASIDFFQL